MLGVAISGYVKSISLQSSSEKLEEKLHPKRMGDG
jgi:hypothetical protein